MAMSDESRTPLIQISLDVTSIPEALEMAHAAHEAGVDWLEAGTPLILAEGLHGIRALRRDFPDVPIVADLKTMDGAGLEGEMMFQAGADMVVVMGQAHDASIMAQVEMARHYDKQVMCDVMLCPDKPGRARRAEELGVDYIIVHTGFDERNLEPERTPLEDLESVLQAVAIPVQAVGGLSVEQAIDTLHLGADIVVFGAPLVIASDAFAAASDDFAGLMKEIVQSIRNATFGTGRKET